MEKLTKKELCELKGGVALLVSSDDVVNKNSVQNCKCIYNNSNNLTNENTVSSCSCVCRAQISEFAETANRMEFVASSQILSATSLSAVSLFATSL